MSTCTCTCLPCWHR